MTEVPGPGQPRDDEHRPDAPAVRPFPGRAVLYEGINQAVPSPLQLNELSSQAILSRSGHPRPLVPGVTQYGVHQPEGAGPDCERFQTLDEQTLQNFLSDVHPATTLPVAAVIGIPAAPPGRPNRSSADAPTRGPGSRSPPRSFDARVFLPLTTAPRPPRPGSHQPTSASAPFARAHKSSQVPRSGSRV